MNKIQVDMYAVGLGAAILTQFRLNNGSVIRVLADGGMGHGNYRPEGVRDRLDTAFRDFGQDERRIDLIIGTHYDGDHLKGLIPIAEDASLQIGEVWLPPVRDDSDEVPGHISEDSGFLVHKFFEDAGEAHLLRYLQAKHAEIEEITEAEQVAITALSEAAERTGDPRPLPNYRPVARESEARITARDTLTLEGYLAFFESEESNAARTTRSESAHGAAEYDSSVVDLRQMAIENMTWREQLTDVTARMAEILPQIRPHRARLMPAVLANVRKSTAASAITAIHLHKLVTALRRRATPVRPKCHYIRSGNPIRFTWDETRQCFVARAGRPASALTLELLGPSDKLVDRHRAKLPIGSYVEALALMRTSIPREAITASNQLSYILILQAHDQRVLVSGDAGCYDFRDGPRDFHPKLIAALSPLHVVQVAHHGGHNYDFYNCLLEANYAEQREASYLLLSHDYRDASRPSDAFRRFIAQLRVNGDDVSLLFTSQPLAAKVRDYDELIAPVTPPGTRQNLGDARLVYAGGREAAAWTVEKHAVAV